MKKTKIAFVVYYLGYGGAEMALYYLVKLMDRERFDITVFTVHAGGEMEKEFRNLGVKVKSPYSCAASGRKPVIKAVNHLLIKRIERMVRSNSPRLLRAATGEEFDIVVSYHVDSTCYNAGLPPRGKKIKYIHADCANSPSYRGDNQYLKEIPNPYDKVICVSSIAQKGYEKVFGEAKTVVPLLNPIESETVVSLAEKPLPPGLEEKPYICALGRLTPEKGFGRLIDVYQRLRKEGVPCTLVIMGDGPEMDTLREKARACHPEAPVLLLGYQSNPYPVIKNSRYLIVPSYSEGLSMTAMEAVCLGIPVVSTCPSVGDIFGDEPCGIITENSDEALYRGMARMNDELFYREAKNAAVRRSRYLDGKAMAGRVEDEYLKTLEEQPSTQ